MVYGSGSTIEVPSTSASLLMRADEPAHASHCMLCNDILQCSFDDCDSVDAADFHLSDGQGYQPGMVMF